MKIIKTTGVVTGFTELSESAREIHIELKDEIDIIAGCFVNLFVMVDGEKLRRAYSISSNSKNKKNITLSIRKNKPGIVSPLFWNDDIIGTEFEIMGTLGLNTADKMTKKKLFLAGFGIGVSVIKSILCDAFDQERINQIHILTGSRNEKEILYKELFNTKFHKKVISAKHIISNPIDEKYPYIGYIQDHVSEYNFNNADIYICGMEKACESLGEIIRKQGCDNSNFFIEGFH